MGFTKRELIEFLDGLVELASEENKVKAVLEKEKFISDFENTYGYEKEGRQMIAAGIIAAVVFVLALSRSAGLADRKMEEIYMLSAVREAGGVDGN